LQSDLNPQPFHTNPEAGNLSIYGGMIASGWHTAALMMRLFVDHYLSHVASLGSPGEKRIILDITKTDWKNYFIQKSFPERGSRVRRPSGVNIPGDRRVSSRPQRIRRSQVMIQPRKKPWV